MSGSLPELDSEIAEFVRAFTGGAKEAPRRDMMELSVVRRIAEEMRAPWRAGGPEMQDVIEMCLGWGGATVKVRIYYPSTERPLPTLIYFHGGGWTIFSLETHDRVMREYAARANVAVVGVDYSQAPEARFPTQIMEGMAVVQSLQDGAVEGIDGRLLAVGGDSAGSNLSFAICLALRDINARLPIGILSNYGVFDARTVLGTQQPRRSVERYGDGRYLLPAHDMCWYWKNYLPDETVVFDPLVSPLLADLQDLPPVWMSIAEYDILHDENVEMRDKLRAAQVPVDANIYLGTVHSFLEAVSIARVANQAFDDAVTWFRDLLEVSLNNKTRSASGG